MAKTIVCCQLDGQHCSCGQLDGQHYSLWSVGCSTLVCGVSWMVNTIVVVSWMVTIIVVVSWMVNTSLWSVGWSTL